MFISQHLLLYLYLGCSKHNQNETDTHHHQWSHLSWSLDHRHLPSMVTAAMMAALLYFSSSASSSRVLIVDYGECPIPVTKSTMGKSHRGKDHRIINTGSLNRWWEMQEPYWLYSLVISHYAKHFSEQKSPIIRGPILL